MPTPTPSPSQLLSFPLINTFGPVLPFALQIIALFGAIYGFIRGIRDVIQWLRRPRLTLYMSDDIWPVAEPNQSQFALNLQFVAYNPGSKMAVLRRLEAKLIRPEFSAAYPQRTFDLEWRRFIKGSPAGFEATEPVYVKAVKPNDSVVLAIQLSGNYQEDDSFHGHGKHFDWFPGRYTLHLYGLVNRLRRRLSPRSGLTFEVTNQVSVELTPIGEIDAPFTCSVQLKRDRYRFRTRMFSR